ncbi:hypothetical protein OIU34_33720 [Pararhizobium sp. BT-229]|nr:KGG domain-containing protein [Pararhizobium sp. BT-229]MCV9966815.1 hypothetical protein [Pararhizobium sp. BT-229]
MDDDKQREIASKGG